jgi:hypothetical protein
MAAYLGRRKVGSIVGGVSALALLALGAAYAFTYLIAAPGAAP